MCEGTLAVKRPPIAMINDDAESALPAAAGRRRTCIYGGTSSDLTAAAFVSLARATWSGGKGGHEHAFRVAIENRAALKATGLDLESKGQAKFSKMNDLLDEARLELEQLVEMPEEFEEPAGPVDKGRDIKEPDAADADSPAWKKPAAAHTSDIKRTDLDSKTRVQRLTQLRRVKKLLLTTRGRQHHAGRQACRQAGSRKHRQRAARSTSSSSQTTAVAAAASDSRSCCAALAAAAAAAEQAPLAGVPVRFPRPALRQSSNPLQ